MSFPGPFKNPRLWRKVVLGGKPVKARCIAVNGIKVEDDWKEQKPTGHSGATNNFNGTKAPGPVKLTFLINDDEEDVDLREHWDRLAPVPGLAGNGTGATAGSPGSAAYQYQQQRGPQAPLTAEQLLAQAQAALAALNAGRPASAAAATATGAPAATTPPVNVGPRPPTLSIEYGPVNYIGITSVSRKSWEGPTVTATNAYEVHIELVAQHDPVVAGVGKSAPKSPDSNYGAQFMQSRTPDAATKAKNANAAAAAYGAGT